MLRIVGDDLRTPALFDASLFIAVSSAIPSNWAVEVKEGGDLTIGPKSWFRQGFWDDYFAGDSNALSQFQLEWEIIKSES